MMHLVSFRLACCVPSSDRFFDTQPATWTGRNPDKHIRTHTPQLSNPTSICPFVNSSMSREMSLQSLHPRIPPYFRWDQTQSKPERKWTFLCPKPPPSMASHDSHLATSLWPPLSVYLLWMCVLVHSASLWLFERLLLTPLVHAFW